jgi:hypothetical protein
MRFSFFKIASCIALSAMLATPFVMASPQNHGKKGSKHGGKKGPVKKGGGRGGVNK